MAVSRNTDCLNKYFFWLPQTSKSRCFSFFAFTDFKKHVFLVPETSKSRLIMHACILCQKKMKIEETTKDANYFRIKMHAYDKCIICMHLMSDKSPQLLCMHAMPACYACMLCMHAQYACILCMQTVHACILLVHIAHVYIRHNSA